MARLERKLGEWVQKDLLSQGQSDGIIGYEQNKSRRNWVLSAFLALGGIVLSIGVISLIAANWEDIPGGAKLFFDFAILAGLIFLAFRLRSGGHEVAFESVVVIYFLLVLASIGLISQVYHSGGELYQALLLWSVFTVSLAAMAQRYVVPFIWTTALLGSLVATAVQEGLPGFGDGRGAAGDRWLGILVLLPLLCAAVHGVLLWMKRGERFQQAFGFWLVVAGVLGTGVIDGTLSTEIASIGVNIALVYDLSVLAVVIIAAAYARIDLSGVQRRLLLAFVGLYIVGAISGFFATPDSMLLGALFSLAMAAIGSAYFGIAGHRRMFNLFTALLGLRFLILYFQAIGGLALTGIGLILSGGVIIGVALLWQKNLARLQRLVEAWGE